MLSLYQAPPAATSGNTSSNTLAPAVGDPLADPAILSAQAASDARRAAVRTFVLPMLIGLVHTSSSTRAKLWASNGLDLFLQLMATEVRGKRAAQLLDYGGSGLDEATHLHPVLDTTAWCRQCVNLDPDLVTSRNCIDHADDFARK